jgi:hypothetical protein
MHPVHPQQHVPQGVAPPKTSTAPINTTTRIAMYDDLLLIGECLLDGQSGGTAGGDEAAHRGEDQNEHQP